MVLVKEHIINLGASRVLFSLPPLVRYLREAQPDALLSALSHANVVAIIAAKIARTHTRIAVSERVTLTTKQYRAATVLSRFIPWLMKELYHSANSVIAVSSGVADNLTKTIGLQRENIDVIYNPTVRDDIYQKSLQPVDMSCLKNRDLPTLLAAGRLIKLKDFQTLTQ